MSSQRRLHLRIAVGHGEKGYTLAVAVRVDVGTGRHERINHRHIISGRRAAMYRSECRPAERCTPVRGIATIDRYAATRKQGVHHLDITHPASGMKCAAPVDAAGRLVEAEPKHQERRSAMPVKDGLSQMCMFLLTLTEN